MTLAQRLYEGGFITYMRTDSTNLPRSLESAVTLVPHCAAYLPEQAPAQQQRRRQEAHEAIRPPTNPKFQT